MDLRRLVTVAVTLVAATLCLTLPADASDQYAPLDRPGPELSVPESTLQAALECHGDPSKGGEPVLLNPATSVTPDEDYGWNYEKAFTAQHRYWCAVTMPYHTFGDIQTAGEYLVYAIRHMHAAAGRQIAVMGHSQGGMSMRWALRFWPDTRPMVDDVIGMAGSNHGTTVLASCIEGLTTCAPAVWQQRDEARFIDALNSGAETFDGVSYTEVYTHTDEVVTPNANDSGSSSLHTGDGRIANVATQDICPADVQEHLLVGTADPVTYALVMDALGHDGPAEPARVDKAVCGTQWQPYVDPADVNTYLPWIKASPNLISTLLPGVNTAGAPMLAREPRLRCYVRASGCA